MKPNSTLLNGPSQRDAAARIRHPGPAYAKTSSRNFLFLAFVVITTLSVGCGKSEQPAGPQTFSSPDDAGSAIYSAAKAGDSKALLAIFGQDASGLISSGDPVQDKDGLDAFSTAYDEMHRWRKLTNGGLALNIGAENYPFPITLLKNSAGQWYFDTSAGAKEILARRVGDNELSTADTLNAIVEAQTEYMSQTHDGSHERQYAQKFISDDGKQNGLYWKVADGQPESPLGPLAAYASAEGYSDKTQPFHGYFYKILTKQGDKAPGGAKDYVVNGSMTKGFAILAYPADYGNSGVMSFLINQDGDLVQKDLGAQTPDMAKSMAEFNPDDTWKPVE